MRTLAVLGLIAGLFAPMPCALANDSVAELRAGGIVLARSDAVSMEREDLYLSMDEVRVAYRFRNHTDEAVETIVAFPMPDLKGSPYEAIALPGEADDNFLDFTVAVNGRPVSPQLQQRAWVAGLDVTEAIKAAGLPLVPDYMKVREAAIPIDPEVLIDLVSQGILVAETHDAGEGLKTYHAPNWTLKSAYWWRMRFDPGQPVDVVHRYTPGIGGTAGLSFLLPDGRPGYSAAEYEQTYCTDPGFLSAVARRLSGEGGGFTESRLSYVLVTANNWFGPIGEFNLTVDKGAVSNFVSFCGEGVTKTGPTTFELTYRDFYPERDLEILFVTPVGR